MYTIIICGQHAVVIVAEAEFDAHSYFQVCLCTSRIFVQRSLYEAFLEKFVALARLVFWVFYFSFALIYCYVFSNWFSNYFFLIGFMYSKFSFFSLWGLMPILQWSLSSIFLPIPTILVLFIFTFKPQLPHCILQFLNIIFLFFFYSQLSTPECLHTVPPMDLLFSFVDSSITTLTNNGLRPNPWCIPTPNRIFGSATLTLDPVPAFIVPSPSSSVSPEFSASALPI